MGPAGIRSGAPPTDDPEPTSTAPGGGAGSARTDEAPGLRAQIGATKDALLRLLKAHRELAMAELHQIIDEVTRAAILAGVAIACLLFVGVLMPVGLVLFLGEWLFGSIGWGVLLGTLLLTDVAVTAVLAALGLSGRTLGRNVVLALVIGVIVGVLFAFHLPNQVWTAVGESINLGVDPAVRPLVTGVVVLAVVAGVVGLIVGGAAGSLPAGLIGGVVVGALLGALSAISFDPGAGAALGVLTWLLVWLCLDGTTVAGEGIDVDALKARFWPQVTIDTTKETVEWVKDQLPVGPRS